MAIANVKFQKAGAPNASYPDYRTLSVTPDMLNESWSIGWWLPRHLQKLDEIRNLQSRHQTSELVFIGDSITHNWEKDGASVWDRNYKKHNALDFGFGGDHTENREIQK